MDISKAFDTTDHHILLNKLDHYGISGHSFNWLSSYLTNRTQLVQFTSVCSQPENRSHPYAIHWFTRIITIVTLHGAQRIHPI